jgi:hypothetical protein
MFGGGGFVGQMHQTNKHNRETLKSNKRKPFDKQGYTSNPSKPILDEKKLTESERVIFLAKLKKEKRQEDIKILIALIVSISIVSILIYFFGSGLKDKVMDFLD